MNPVDIRTRQRAESQKSEKTQFLKSPHHESYQYYYNDIFNRQATQIRLDYKFVPFGVETFVPWGPGARDFFKDISPRLFSAAGDRKAGCCFTQRISIAIKRGNAASVLANMPHGYYLHAPQSAHNDIQTFLSSMMGDEEENIVEVTLEEQFLDFAKMLEPKERDGTTIDLYSIDYWLRQADILNDRAVTMTDTGMLFFKLNKSEINFEEFTDLIKDLVDTKDLNLDDVISSLCTCGLPGSIPVKVPQYRDYFLTWQPKNNKSEIDFDEFLVFLEDLADLKGLDLEKLQETLTNCGIPGTSAVFVPQYRDFFLTYKPKEKMMF